MRPILQRTKVKPTMKNLLLATAAVLALGACGQTETTGTQTETSTPAAATPTAEQVAAETARLNAWFDEKYEEELMLSPMTLTTLGRRERYDEIDDVSPEAQLEQLEWRRATTAEMQENFDYDLLDAEAKMSWDLYEFILAQAEENWQWRHHGYIFTQSGWQTYPAQFMINFHGVSTEEDMLAYISRLDGFATMVNSLVSQAEEAAQMGIRPPAFAYRAAAEQSQNIVTGAPFTEGDDSAIFADAKGKIAALVEAGTITEERGEELIADVEAALTGSFLSAYNNMINWLETDVANTEEAFGVSELPDGEAYYQQRLGYYTTTDMTADEIHELGLEEVARLRGEMVSVMRDFGFEGTLQEFFVFLRENKDDERLYFPNTDEGRQGYIDAATYYVENIESQLPEYFGLLPQAELEVRRVEAFRERDGAAQHYYPSTPDGSRPGVYYAHLSDMTAMPKRELEVIAYHEALPGHHMQIAIAQELTGIPQFRTQQFYGAYVEGWALYTEHFAQEIPGTYQDPLSQFGRLGSEIWRAIRLVVDTGLHVKGWTREEAVAYFQENSAITDAQALSEVERYIADPGQATGYKIGMIFIQDLRANAEEVLGDDFDIRGFHDAVLGGGGLPLNLLEQRVDNWIASVQAS